MGWCTVLQFSLKLRLRYLWYLLVLLMGLTGISLGVKPTLGETLASQEVSLTQKDKESKSNLQDVIVSEKSLHSHNQELIFQQVTNSLPINAISSQVLFQDVSADVRVSPSAEIKFQEIKGNSTFLSLNQSPTEIKQSFKETPKTWVVQDTISPESNRDRFVQPAPLPTPIPESTETPVNTTPVPTSPPAIVGGNIKVQTIQVEGSSIFGEAEFNPLVEPLVGRNVSAEELQNLADQITQLYLEQGYITSRAIIDENSLATGNIKVRVIEGSLEDIEVQGTDRLDPDYIRDRIALGGGTPLNTASLEDQLRLLRTDPLLENIEASLKSGTGLGQSILVVKVTESPSLYGNLSIDNYSPPSVGSERLGINLRYRNVSGIGDDVGLLYQRTLQGGSDNLDLSYRIPVNAMNGTVQLRSVLNFNNVIQENLAFLDISGESDLYELSYRQPIIRTPREELALSVGFTFQEGQTFTFAGPTAFGQGPDPVDGTSGTSVLKFGQEYISRDSSGAWALRSSFNLGTGLFDPTDVISTVNGYFFSWLGQFQRVQLLNPDNFLIIQADLQLTPDGLLPSQQFVIGGGQSVRGYRQNARAGDNGFRISVEDRITLHRNEAGEAVFQVAPFWDMGNVWNVSDNPNILQNQTFMMGLGMGLLWQPLPKLNLRLDYGFPIYNLDDRGRNAQDDGFYFSVNYGL
jgi:hemolysin activation/secretion protein